MNRTPPVQAHKPSLTERIYNKLEEILFGLPSPAKPSPEVRGVIDRYEKGTASTQKTVTGLHHVVGGTGTRQSRQAQLSLGDSSSVDFLKKIR